MLRSLLVSLVLAATAGAQVSYFSASLDGSQVVTPTGSPGRGWGIVRLVEPANTVTVFLHVTGMSGPGLSARMHLGGVGVNGGILINLVGGPGNWTGSGTLGPAGVAALQTAGAYLNVQTAAFPGGELRGQIVAPTTVRFTALLDGGQTVPPSGSAATGEAVAFLYQPDDRLVYTVTTQGLAGVTGARIRMAPAGGTGPSIHTLMGSAGQYSGVTGKLPAAELAALLADGLYLEVDTAAFPGGEIRGQLLRSAGDDFGGVLTGAQAVPPVASPGIGNACLQIQPNGAVRYRVQMWHLTSQPTAAYVHVAPPGLNGGVVFPLAGTVPLVFSGTSDVLTPAQLADCRLGNWHVIVRTTGFPGGELRGQMGPLALPTVFGGGCPRANGVIVAASARSPLCVGGSIQPERHVPTGGLTQLDGHGAAPVAPGILVLGLSRDAAGFVPLPQEFTAVGLNAPGCFFLVDPWLAVFLSADALGALRATVSPPLDHNLIGLVLYFQWFVFDQANPAGVVSSNAMRMTMQ
jgi:hypothetical protein